VLWAYIKISDAVFCFAIETYLYSGAILFCMADETKDPATLYIDGKRISLGVGGDDIAETLRQELEGVHGPAEMAELVVSGGLVHKATVMDAVRWDALYVRAICASADDKDNAEGYKFDSAGREKRLPVERRKGLYRKATALIDKYPQFFPQDVDRSRLSDIIERLSSGGNVSMEEAELAADVFTRYNVYYLEMFQGCQRIETRI